jgi:hypothetical protein
MGLGGLTVISDDDAMGIRGHGFWGGHRFNGMNGGDSSAGAIGNSFATLTIPPFVNTNSENSYAAEGEKFASGKNRSEVGVEIALPSGLPLGGLIGNNGPNPGQIGNLARNRNGGHGGMNGRPNNGGHGGMNGGPNGGNNGPRPNVISVRFFAGGFSSAAAH